MLGTQVPRTYQGKLRGRSYAQTRPRRCSMRVECLDGGAEERSPYARSLRVSLRNTFLLFFFLRAQASLLKAGNTYSIRVDLPYETTMETAS